MKKIITALITSLLMILTPMAQAEIDQSAYQGIVPIASQSPDDLQQAIPQALSQVLTKLSGNPQITQSGKVKNALNQATNMVQSYNYVTNTSPTNPPQTSLMLQVQFYPQAIDELLQQAGAANVASQSNSAAQLLTLHIDNVNGLDDYANVVKYLRSLPPVSQVEASDINPGALIITVTVNGGIGALNKALMNGTELQSITPPSDTPNNTSDTLFLHWTGTATPSTNSPDTANPNPTSNNNTNNNGIDMGA